MIVENSRYFIFKNEILNSYIEFKKEINSETVIKILILLNKYYPSFLISRIDFLKEKHIRKWEDVILDKNIITSKHDFSMDLYVPLYYPTSKDFSNIGYGIIEDSMRIYYGFDNNLNKRFFAINFYGNLYTNIVSYWEIGTDLVNVNLQGKYVSYDISEIAAKNRANMRSLLIELESLLEGDISEYLSHHLYQNDLNKYGINEDAVIMP